MEDGSQKLQAPGACAGSRVRGVHGGYIWPSLLSVWAAAWVRLASRPSLPPDRGSPLYIIIPTYYLPRYLTLASNAR